MTGETVLYYNPRSTEKNGSLTRVLFRMKIRMRRVETEELDRTVGALAGLPGFRGENTEPRTGGSVEVCTGGSARVCTGAAAEASPAETGAATEIPEEVLVFSGMSDRRLSELLNQLRKAGVGGGVLKAVVTPTSCGWTFRQLYEELSGERAAFAAQTAQSAQSGSQSAQPARSAGRGQGGEKERSEN